MCSLGWRRWWGDVHRLCLHRAFTSSTIGVVHWFALFVVSAVGMEFSSWSVWIPGHCISDGSSILDHVLLAFSLLVAPVLCQGGAGEGVPGIHDVPPDCLQLFCRRSRPGRSPLTLCKLPAHCSCCSGSLNSMLSAKTAHLPGILTRPWALPCVT